MIGSRNHLGVDRPIRAGQTSSPGGTKGGKGRNMCAVAFSRKEGTFLSRVACSGGGARLVSRPAHFPEVPPLLVSKWPTGSFAPGRNHREGQFPPLLRAQRRISRDTFPHDHHRTLPHSRSLHGARGLGGFVSHRSPMCQSSN